LCGSDESGLPQVPLFPELECYSGSFELLPSFLAGSPVQSIAKWYRKHGSYAQRLEQDSIPLENIFILSETLDSNFFESLIRHAPRVLLIEFEVEIEDVNVKVV